MGYSTINIIFALSVFAHVAAFGGHARPVAKPICTQEEIGDAVLQGDKATLRSCFENNSDDIANFFSEEGETIFHRAVIYNKLPILELLINWELGKGIHKKDRIGNTPLHYGAYQGNREIIDFLVSLGANVHVENEKGQTALHIAIEQGHLLTAQELIKFGANTDCKDKGDITPLGLIEEPLERRGLLKIAKTYELAIRQFHDAVKAGDLDKIYQSLDSGLSIHAQDKKGWNAVRWSIESNKPFVMKELIDRGGNLKAIDESGHTALHWAAISDKPKLLALLLELGVDEKIKDNEGKKALEYADLLTIKDAMRWLRLATSEDNANLAKAMKTLKLREKKIYSEKSDRYILSALNFVLSYFIGPAATSITLENSQQ